MRREVRWLFAAIAALGVGAVGASDYARMAAPFYKSVATVIAHGRPWQIENVDVAVPDTGPGGVLRLTGWVRENAADVEPSARLVSRMHVSAAVESPLIFWTVLLMWPAASLRDRLVGLALGVPIFLCLESATTVCQLLNPFSCASAVLAGDADPVTPWEHWSRFLEEGGRVGLALCTALLTANLVQCGLSDSSNTKRKAR
jgi:hypothetical protein